MERSLYFHVPFCLKKCNYCHFYSITDNQFEKYMLALQKEFAMQSHLLKGKIKSIYFGGGTPSLLGTDNIASILKWINPQKETEITLEANPDTINRKDLKAYLNMGINRLSIGVQSFDDKHLRFLGRTHNAKRAVEAIEMAHDVGFENISIDLMYDLPNQTLEDWQDSLQKAVSLPITHVSIYNLTIEPKTIFFKRRKNLKMPSQDISKKMLRTGIKILRDRGFLQYEISAFAKKGSESKHNLGYWTGRPFLGFGPSAFSYFEERRFRNVANLDEYCKRLEKGQSPVDFEEELSSEDKQKELLAIGLRVLEGIDLRDFKLDKNTTQTLERLKEQKLIKGKNKVSLTKKGVFFYDDVASEII